MRAENFEKLLYDNGNSKAEVAFLDSYWRTIFESGNLQTDKIREELMKGHKLLGVYRAGELLIEPLGNTGLYTVMACPSVFSTEVLNSMYSIDHPCFWLCCFFPSLRIGHGALTNLLLAGVGI